MFDTTNHSPKNNARRPIRKIGDLPEIPRLKLLREDILQSAYHLCSQKASLMTEYFRKNRRKTNLLPRALTNIHFKMYKKALENARRNIPQKDRQAKLGNLLNRLYLKLETASGLDSQMEFARAFQHTLRRMPIIVYERELIVGNPSSFRVGAPIHPDLGGLMTLPEIDGLADRPLNPIRTNPEQLRELHENIFPFWFNRSVMARAPLHSRDPNMFKIPLEGSYYILTQFSGVSHVTPDYPTVLKLGFRGLKKSAEKALEKLQNSRIQPNELKQKTSFYKASVIVADAAIEYGDRWKSELEIKAKETFDPFRRAELEELASIFGNIPANPPSSFHEAVQMVFFTHAIIHQESFQHGVSFGRMDQYLLPYYERDARLGKDNA